MKKEDEAFSKEFNDRLNILLQFAVSLTGGQFSSAMGLLHAALEHITMMHKNAQMKEHMERELQSSSKSAHKEES